MLDRRTDVKRVNLFNHSAFRLFNFCSQHKTKRSLGFTLAEVLITIGIIGVIAALTIPNLIQDSQEKATVVAVKKAYSTIANAYNLAVQEEGSPDNWISSNTKIIDTLAPYLKITKNCGSGTGCLDGIIYKRLDNIDWVDAENSATVAKAQMLDGTILMASAYSNCTLYNWGNTPALQNLCGEIYVDINGTKKPNQFGKDIFLFNLTKYGIIPSGTIQYTTSYTFNTCTTAGTGFGCTAWVLQNENLDYLKCRSDISWTGKTKCD